MKIFLFLMALALIFSSALGKIVFINMINANNGCGPGYFTFTPDSGCSPLTATFRVSSQSSTYIKYDYGDGVIDSVSNIDTLRTHIYHGNNAMQWIPHVYLGDTASSCLLSIPNYNPGGDTIVKILAPISVNIDTILGSLLAGHQDTVVASPYNSTWTYHWYVFPRADSLATLSLSTEAVYIPQSGDQEIVLVAQDVNGCQSYDTLRVVIIPTSGIIELNENNYKLYPNPSIGVFNIAFSKNIHNASLKIFNTLGELIYQTTISNQKTEIDLSEQPAGIYFLQVNDGEKQYMSKLIVE